MTLPFRRFRITKMADNKKPKVTRETHVQLRLTVKQKEQIRGEAEWAGMSMSDYIRFKVFGGREIHNNSSSDARVKRGRDGRS